MGFRFRLTFRHSSPGFFRFEEQSIPVELAEGLDLILTARDADSLARAARFHIEGRGFPYEESARSVGERLRLRLRVLSSLLGLGIAVPAVDLRRVQSVCLQRADFPNSLPLKVLRRVLSRAYSA